MVAWFAGLFYIFRLFVYHLENWDEPKAYKVFETMERKLLNIIMLPAAILTTFFGLWMLMLNPYLLTLPWMHAKLTFILVLYGYHIYSHYVHTQLKNRNAVLTSKACRVINEVPTLVLIAVCVLVLVKPVFS
jgi:putative membrane protein